MASPDSTLRISLSACRQLLSAAADAGLGGIMSPGSVRNDGDHVVITVTAREVRALTNWLLYVAESHRDAPITASTVRPTADESDDDPGWMHDVTDVRRATPVGYDTVNIPSREKGSNS